MNITITNTLTIILTLHVLTLHVLTLHVLTLHAALALRNILGLELTCLAVCLAFLRCPFIQLCAFQS